MPSRLIIWLLPLLLLGCSAASPPWHGHDISGLMPDLAFELTDDRSRPASAADSAGKLRLLYFGFSHCKNVCPTTLATLGRSIARLGPDADKVRVLFVSVDPARDTPEILHQYTAHFGPQIQGLTGSQQQLRTLSQRYRVSYSYGPKDNDGNYMVYHSSAVFVFDGQGRIRLLLDNDLGDEAIAADLRRLLDEVK